MKYSIGKTISKSIKENKWLSIDYINKEGLESSFWCSVLDVDMNSKFLKVDIFNIFKGKEVLNSNIYFENIKKASVVDGTYYDNGNLVKIIEKNISKVPWLEFDNFNDKIFDYYSEAKKLDVDPYQNDYSNVSGIDTRILQANKKIKLNDEQFEIIAKDIYKIEEENNKNEGIEKTNRYSQLAINKLSIYDRGKEYVVAYYPLKLDVSKKTLMINDDLIINKSFLIGDNKISLNTYLTIDQEVFLNLLKSNFEEAKEMLRDNLRSFEKLDENPLLMLISREVKIEFDAVYESIVEKHKNGTLELPMKAFFGELSKRNRGKVEPNIVLMDKKADIDQVRVVYNAMKNPVTYVQGPPGTGKTTTLMNVVLSSFLNDNTCLICSNNNHPIDDILKKFHFECKYGEVKFPIIRLGNREELGKSLNKINELLQINDDKIKVYEDKLTQLMKKTSEGYANLKTLLAQYEEKKEIIESKQYLDKFYNFVMSNKESSNRLKNKIQEQKDNLESKLKALPDITNEQVLSNVKFLKDDPDFLMYLYFNSFKYIKKLKQPAFKDLRDIVAINDKEKRINDFGKWLKDDNNFRKLLKVFPVIACTNISCIKLGTNESYFDICIMDEAGQCDVAASLIPISKSKHLLLVGDVNQLQPVITLDDTINNKLMDKFEVPEIYDYCHNSIMNLMTHVDDISTQILLSYHYRCGKKIANYSNNRYYDGQLTIKTSLDGHQLEYIKVKNDFFGKERNSYQEEALAVVEYIKKNNLDETNVSIITPFRNQAALINEELAKNNIKAKCGTIHTVQGAENKNIIFSPAIGLKSSKKTYEWLANNKELINVAVTRAQNKFVMVADDEALESLSNKKVEDDIIALRNYIKENGDITVSKSTVNKIEIGLSNGSECENELFETMTHFCSVYKSFSVRRNQPVSKVLSSVEKPILAKYFKKAEFDLVLYSKNMFGRLKPHLVIELNGGEHYISKSTSAINDKNKMKICKEYDIQYLAIPNTYSKSYETISNLIFALNGEPDEEYNLFSISYE